MTGRSDQAILLNTHELGEADLIVTLLTPGHGKVRGVARSARKSRKRFRGVLEAMSLLEVRWSEREGRELHTLEEAESLHSYAAMQSEPLLLAGCAVMAEIALAYSHEGQADARQFRLIRATLDALEAGGDARNLLRYFEYWTLAIHGLLPDLMSCNVCGEPLEAGSRRIGARQGLLCRRCPLLEGERASRIGEDVMRWMDGGARRPPSALSTQPPPGGRSLELLLRGTLQNYAERRFRSYRHFEAVALPPASGDLR